MSIGELAPQMRSETINGIETAYFDIGEGRPIVFIHGGEPGGSVGALMWRENAPALSAGYRVLGLDRPGQGRSGNMPGDAAFDIVQICEHVERFLEVRGVGDDAIIVGQSRGAFVAAYLAWKYPHRRTGLVIVNSASFAPKRAVKHDLYLKTRRGQPDTVRHDEEWLTVKHHAITDEWVDVVADIIGAPAQRRSKEIFEATAEDYYRSFEDIKESVLGWFRDGGFEGPSLTIWGTKDPMASFADGLEIFDLLRAGDGAARLYALQDCGHCPFSEQADIFNRQIELFIEEQIMGGARK